MNRRGLLGLLGATFALAGCEGLKPDPAAEATAKLAYQKLTAKDDAGLEAMMLPAARGPNDTLTFALMRSRIPAGPPKGVPRTGFSTYAGTGGRSVTFVHVYGYGTWLVTATTRLVPDPAGQGWRLAAFNVDSERAPQVPGAKT